MRKKSIRTFYRPEQVLDKGAYSNYSKSPLKPKLLLEHLTKNGLIEHFSIDDTFSPFQNADFKIAHDPDYIDEFFGGYGRCRSNSLNWSKEFAKTVRYTNASLYEAIKNSIVNPDEVSFSPTSGFHHARPNAGMGFCTFSGQVIASLKIYKKFGLSGAYFDLDGHFGNSIEDSRLFCPDLNKAVPPDFNINPISTNENYLADLALWLERTKQAILQDRIHYVVWCHGADSHEYDDLGHQCSTEYWLACSTLFWTWVKEMDEILGRPLPISCALFGGYRSDDYDSVLSLHTGDFVECLRILLGLDVKYTVKVVTPLPKFNSYYDDQTERSNRRAPKKVRRSK